MCGAFAIRCPACVEQRAGKIQPLLDIHRVARVLQHHAHLFGDRHEQVVEDLEHHRIDRGADRVAAAQCLEAGQHQMIARGDLGLPPGSTTVVAFGSMIIAGPAMRSCGRNCSRSKTGVSWSTPPACMATVATAAGGVACGSAARIRSWTCSVTPIASTETASTIVRLAGGDEAEPLPIRRLERADNPRPGRQTGRRARYRFPRT